MVAAVAGLGMAAAMLMPAVMATPGTSQAAAVSQSTAVDRGVVAPAKPATEGAGVTEQKCHIHFNPLVEHELRHVDLVKLQIIVDVDCRGAIGSVSLFGEGRLLEKLNRVLDDAATLHGAVILNEDKLERGFCVDVEVDSTNNDETHWGQCFFKEDEILEAKG